MRERKLRLGFLNDFKQDCEKWTTRGIDSQSSFNSKSCYFLSVEVFLSVVELRKYFSFSGLQFQLYKMIDKRFLKDVDSESILQQKVIFLCSYS